MRGRYEKEEDWRCNKRRGWATQMPILQRVRPRKVVIRYFSLLTDRKIIKSDSNSHWDIKHSQAIDLAGDIEKIERDSGKGREGYLQYHDWVQTQVFPFKKTARKDQVDVSGKLNSIKGCVDQGKGSFEARTDIQAHDGGHYEASEGFIGAKLRER